MGGACGEGGVEVQGAIGRGLGRRVRHVGDVAAAMKRGRKVVMRFLQGQTWTAASTRKKTSDRP